MFDVMPGMELTPTNPMTLKPHGLKSPAQVGNLSLFHLRFVLNFLPRRIHRNSIILKSTCLDNLHFSCHRYTSFHKVFSSLVDFSDLWISNNFNFLKILFSKKVFLYSLVLMNKLNKKKWDFHCL